MSLKILFADDELSLQELMRQEIPAMGHTVTICPDGITAIAAIQKDSFDCLLVDLDMPGAGGLEVIAEAKERCPDADAVILTGKGTLDTAISAIRNGVFDYMTKPYRLTDLETIFTRIENKRELTHKYLAVKNQLNRLEGERQLIGSSELMMNVQRMIDKIAPTDSTVVLLGETGTGKELAARAVHDRSLRRDKPFVAINCGALPENLIESELFGHRKGSFTGADSHRTGLFQVADGGTLFLDEIGELPKGVQSKLLRFLESGEVRKVGENTPSTCDVRVVCATLRNLESMVKNGSFREDLWFRINTFEIELPPLRERMSDFPELVLHLAKRYQSGVNMTSGDELFVPEANAILHNYYWPGNIRQLANAIEHALILTDKIPIEVDALPHPILAAQNIETQKIGRDRIIERKPGRPITKSPGQPQVSNHGPLEELLSFNPSINDTQNKTLRDMELDAILSAIERNDGNKAKAADELGISLKTLYNKINQATENRKMA